MTIEQEYSEPLPSDEDWAEMLQALKDFYNGKETGE